MNNLLTGLIAAAILVMAGCGRGWRGDGYWGDSDGKLRIHVEVTEQDAQQHLVRIVFQNVSSSPLKIWESGFWPNILLKCADNDGRGAQTTVEGANLLKAFSPGGSRDKNYLVSLAPNRMHSSDSVSLERVFVLKPSTTYHVSAVYEEHWAGGWSGRITSNVVAIRSDEGGKK